MGTSATSSRAASPAAAPTDGPYLVRLRRPMFLINAGDDPFVPPGALPAAAPPPLTTGGGPPCVPPGALPEAAALPPGVVAEFPPHGGHAGFIDGPPWRV